MSSDEELSGIMRNADPLGSSRDPLKKSIIDARMRKNYDTMARLLSDNADERNIGDLLLLFNSTTLLLELYKRYKMLKTLEFAAIRNFFNLGKYKDIERFLPFVKFRENIYYILSRVIDDPTNDTSNIIKKLLFGFGTYHFNNINVTEEETILNPMDLYVNENGDITDKTLFDIVLVHIAEDFGFYQHLLSIFLSTGKITYSETHLKLLPLEYVVEYYQSIIKDQDVISRLLYRFLTLINFKRTYWNNIDVFRDLLYLINKDGYNMNSIINTELYSGTPLSTIFERALFIRNDEIVGMTLGYGGDIYIGILI